MTTDIVVPTCERLDLLKQTLDHIWSRTVMPYRLHIIDDASTEGNADYVRELEREGRIYSAVLRSERRGIAENLREALRITVSDPLVITDDDILCPQLDPDWLTRGLKAMERDPALGVLALNNPQANAGDDGACQNRRKATVTSGAVTYCRNVGGTFAFVRRAALAEHAPPDGTVSCFKALCISSHRGRSRWRVGYLTNVYCQHIGVKSVRMGRQIHRRFDVVQPLNPETLEPARRYRG